VKNLTEMLLKKDKECSEFKTKNTKLKLSNKAEETLFSDEEILKTHLM
jgi:hypothetical protein